MWGPQKTEGVSGKINVLIETNKRLMNRISNSMNKLSPCKTPFVVPIDEFLSITSGSAKNSERGSSLPRLL